MPQHFEPFLIASVLDRLSILVVFVSLFALGGFLTTLRMGSVEDTDMLPSLAFVFVFVCEAFSRSGLLFFTGNTTERAFKVLQTQMQQGPKVKSVLDMFNLGVNVAAVEDDASRLLLRAVSLGFALQLAVFFYFNVRKLASKPFDIEKLPLRTKVAYTIIVASVLVIVGATSVGCGMAFGKNPLDNRIPPYNHKDFKTLAENIQSCNKGPFGPGDALVSLALLFTSMTWTKNGGIFGLENYFALRFLATYLAFLGNLCRKDFLELTPKATMNYFPMQVQLGATIIQVVLILALFVPRYIVMRPILAILLIAAGLGSTLCATGYYVIPPMIAQVLLPLIGKATVYVALLAVIACGGVGVVVSVLILAATAGVQAPWLMEF